MNRKMRFEADADGEFKAILGDLGSSSRPQYIEC